MRPDSVHSDFGTLQIIYLLTSVTAPLSATAETRKTGFGPSLVTAILFELALPTFDTTIINSKQHCARCSNSVQNSL